MKPLQPSATINPNLARCIVFSLLFLCFFFSLLSSISSLLSIIFSALVFFSHFSVVVPSQLSRSCWLLLQLTVAIFFFSSLSRCFFFVYPMAAFFFRSNVSFFCHLAYDILFIYIWLTFIFSVICSLLLSSFFFLLYCCLSYAHYLSVVVFFFFFACCPFFLCILRQRQI